MFYKSKSSKHWGLSLAGALIITSYLVVCCRHNDCLATAADANSIVLPQVADVASRRMDEEASSSSGADLTRQRGAIINIKAELTAGSMPAVRRQIDRALEQGIETIIFRFSGIGRSFDGFSDLAHDIALLSSREHIRTIAYVPKQAKGMTMLAVFACQEIATDDFAQLGQVVTDRSVPEKTDEKSSVVAADEQTVINKIVSFARATGHDSLLARAMAEKRMILYEIGLNGQRKLVDQAAFERFTQREQPPWRMMGSGPIKSTDRVLLLSGRRAYELGLVAHLVVSEAELAEAVHIDLVEITAKSKKTKLTQDDANAPSPTVEAEEETKQLTVAKPPKATVIICTDMIDQGLYESIQRRTESALENGSTYLIYQIDTFGGRVDSAIAISNYFLHEVAGRAHTVAYIPTEALSAGALISVACKDIIMKKATKLGDCAPILMGGKLEGTEREKAESFLRANFEASAEANGYPVALCKAMVTMSLEVYQVKNLETGEPEFFEPDQLPNDPYIYDLENKTLAVKKDELLTLTAEKAFEYGINRKVVEGLEGALVFLEQRDKVAFARPVETLATNWSEELVRWLTSPTVAGILLMVALLGIYAELNSPGLGLPGAVAVVALAVLFGSKYLIGLANWWEIAVFVIGLGLLIMEIFVIPGFGVAGISGVVLILFSLAAMMVQNKPDEFPIPASPVDWQLFESHLLWMIAGFVGFTVIAYFIGRYLPHIPVANKLILQAQREPAIVRTGSQPAPAPELPPVEIGQTGLTLSQLRPSGTARFGASRLNVVSRGELIEAGKKITVVDIEGNSIVVKEIVEQEDYT